MNCRVRGPRACFTQVPSHWHHDRARPAGPRREDRRDAMQGNFPAGDSRSYQTKFGAQGDKSRDSPFNDDSRTFYENKMGLQGNAQRVGPYDGDNRGSRGTVIAQRMGMAEDDNSSDGRSSAQSNRFSSDGVAQPASNSGRMPPASMHKHVLAQEVVKLRREIAQLKASRTQTDDDIRGEENQIKMARIEVARLEAQKQEIISQANTQKEASSLRAELERLGSPAVQFLPDKKDAPGRELAEALLKRREFEDNFTRTVRDLRKELENSSLKYLSSRDQAPMGVRTLLQLSNERIDKVMEESAQVQVEDRLHIEALRLLIENSKLRKALNEYSEGLLEHALIKTDPIPDIDTSNGSNKSKSFFGLL